MWVQTKKQNPPHQLASKNALPLSVKARKKAKSTLKVQSFATKSASATLAKAQTSTSAASAGCCSGGTPPNYTIPAQPQAGVIQPYNITAGMHATRASVI